RSGLRGQLPSASPRERSGNKQMYVAESNTLTKYPDQTLSLRNSSRRADGLYADGVLLQEESPGPEHMRDPRRSHFSARVEIATDQLWIEVKVVRDLRTNRCC
ncbi:MAG: hypothetical protein WAM39_12525, partial [Bryobacteraceae bacterium]